VDSAPDTMMGTLKWPRRLFGVSCGEQARN
jgi:hypothetical protein